MYYPQNNEKPFPLIDLGDYILREKQEWDAEDFLAYYNDPEVNRFIMCEIPQDMETARRDLMYWRGIFYQNDGAYFAIATKEDNRMIGSIGVTGYNAYNSRIELSYDLARPYWRKGITEKAVYAVMRYGFIQWRVNRMEAYVAVNNVASRNLLLKCGFTFEGILRQHRYHRGRYVDVCSFSILRSDLKSS